VTDGPGSTHPYPAVRERLAGTEAPARDSRSALLRIVWMALAMTLAAPGQTLPVNGQEFGEWMVGCERSSVPADPVCYLCWNSPESSGEPVRLAVFRRDGEPEPLARVVLPLGIELDSPARISAGELSRPIEVRYCLIHGCEGEVSLDGVLDRAVAAGEPLRLTYTLDEGGTAEVDVSLGGLMEGLRTLAEPEGEPPPAP
jgi:invasion protein IalB